MTEGPMKFPLYVTSHFFFSCCFQNSLWLLNNLVITCPSEVPIELILFEDFWTSWIWISTCFQNWRVLHNMFETKLLILCPPWMPALCSLIHWIVFLNHYILSYFILISFFDSSDIFKSYDSRLTDSSYFFFCLKECAANAFNHTFYLHSFTPGFFSFGSCWLLLPVIGASHSADVLLPIHFAVYFWLFYVSSKPF